MKGLLIAEKPSLMQSIKSVYDRMGAYPDQLDFTCFAGHTMSLILPSEYKDHPEWTKRSLTVLPMIPKKFEYKVTPDKQKMYDGIVSKLKAGHYDFVVNACDPGREGQLIFFSFYNSLKTNLPVKRIWHNDTTDAEIERALRNLLDERSTRLTNLTQASFLRAYFDWLIGMNFSSGLSLAAHSNIAVGRVMTPTLKIIVDRDLEIKNFKPEKYLTLDAQFNDYAGTLFSGSTDQPQKFSNKKDLETFVNVLGKAGTVGEVVKKTEKRKAPSLFSLQGLQAEANKLFGYKMTETLNLVQKLYERKLLSYPRTDSQHITAAMSKEFPALLKPLLAVKSINKEVATVLADKTAQARVAKDKSYVDDAKVSDHYAITPTKLTPDFSVLTKDEVNIYELVAKRFLAIFMDPMVIDKTKIITLVDGKHRFGTTGNIIVDKGFMALYKFSSKDVVLPNVKKGDTRTITKIVPSEKVTTPPAHFTDGTLGTAMENAGRFSTNPKFAKVLKEAKGIGTPATRGNIIDKLAKKDMIDYRKKNIVATDYGIELIQGLNNHDVTSVDLTALWEQRLEQVEDGKISANDYYKLMLGYIQKRCIDFQTLKISLSSSSGSYSWASPSIGKCPKCGAPVIDGKKYYLCSKYKNPCDFIVGKTQFGAKIGKTEIKKLLDGKETKELNFKFVSGKTGKGTLKYDKTQSKLVILFSKSTGKIK